VVNSHEWPKVGLEIGCRGKIWPKGWLS